MREFTAEYLDATRTGMWEQREPLADLALGETARALDVGAGTGKLTAVLREECPGEVIALDADRSLLEHVAPPAVLGDAVALPFRSNSVELVVCQALLVNLPDPVAAIEEFARVATDRVAAIEPDNAAVSVESTVEGEAELTEQARASYLRGVDTDAAIGDARELFAEAGIDAATVRRYDHQRVTEPPYSEQALEAARRKASGAAIESDRETILAGETSPEAFDTLRERWRAIGREAIEQIQRGEYRRVETVPFYVTVGTLG